MNEPPYDNPESASRAGKKPTREELEQRIDYALFLLQRRLYKSDCKRFLKRRYGVNHSTCERYLSRARARLSEQRTQQTGRTKAERRGDALNFYESVVSGPDATIRERLYAQERIDKLEGFEAPHKVAPMNLDGADSYAVPSVTNDQLLDRLLPVLAARQAEGDAGPTTNGTAGRA